MLFLLKIMHFWCKNPKCFYLPSHWFEKGHLFLWLWLADVCWNWKSTTRHMTFGSHVPLKIINIGVWSDFFPVFRLVIQTFLVFSEEWTLEIVNEWDKGVIVYVGKENDIFYATYFYGRSNTILHSWKETRPSEFSFIRKATRARWRDED